VETDDFVLCPLTVDRFHLDYESYMASVEHLQNTFDVDEAPFRVGGERWPAGTTLELALIDAAWCHMEWKVFRSSFTYSALAKSEKQQLGCGYIFPSHKSGIDVVCQTWVRADELDSGFDQRFYEWFRQWVETAWPFGGRTIGWPGREISWDAWSALPDRASLLG
jgi:hypothetical protein